MILAKSRKCLRKGRYMNGFRGTGYCATGRWFRRGTDTQGVVRGNDSSRRKKEFYVNSVEGHFLRLDQLLGTFLLLEQRKTPGHRVRLGPALSRSFLSLCSSATCMAT